MKPCRGETKSWKCCNHENHWNESWHLIQGLDVRHKNIWNKLWEVSQMPLWNSIQILQRPPEISWHAIISLWDRSSLKYTIHQNLHRQVNKSKMKFVAKQTLLSPWRKYWKLDRLGQELFWINLKCILLGNRLCIRPFAFMFSVQTCSKMSVDDQTVTSTPRDTCQILQATMCHWRSSNNPLQTKIWPFR